ncbi:MAG TPA: hypothetical protein VI893_03860, partial [Thermoplasmata archaeon]|nr:hypothetical protein [Thermoplasmata archaeon]
MPPGIPGAPPGIIAPRVVPQRWQKAAVALSGAPQLGHGRFWFHIETGDCPPGPLNICPPGPPG